MLLRARYSTTHSYTNDQYPAVEKEPRGMVQNKNTPQSFREALLSIGGSVYGREGAWLSGFIVFDFSLFAIPLFLKALNRVLFSIFV